MTETTGTDRIRWEPTKRGGWTGHVGTLAEKSWLFQIWNAAPVGGVWQLDSTLPGDFGHFATSTDTDELKAEAERWLSGFVASLGAIFPDAVLKLAGELEHLRTGPPSGKEDEAAALGLRWSGVKVREAITAALTGKEAGDEKAGT